MRIISGSHKGRIIQIPKDFEARPTTDKAKEGLFNILENNIYWDEIKALDLFSGTGSIALEIVSRGCTDVLAIEQNKRYVAFIRQNAELLKMENNLVAYATDVFKYIEQSAAKFDLIFADPPYDLPNIDSIPQLVFQHELLRPGGWLVVEHPPTINLAGLPFFLRHRNYGKVNFTFFEQPAIEE